jgi:type I restriction enzyme M protein
VDQRPGVLLFPKEVTRFDTKFKPIGDWPMGDETIGTREGASLARMRRADPVMLRTAFRRCHNYIHGNEGMPKDAAFWQFLYLIFCKMYDERQPRRAACLLGRPLRTVQTRRAEGNPQAHRAAFRRVKRVPGPLQRQRRNHPVRPGAGLHRFRTLTLRLWAHRCRCQGRAYQEIVGTNLRGDRGQYFTPRGAIRLVVQMLAPRKANACWTRPAARVASWSRPCAT